MRKIKQFTICLLIGIFLTACNVVEPQEIPSGNQQIENITQDSITNITEGLLQVHYIDVGQGDATLLICDEHAMLIDCGENGNGTYLQNYLTSQGVTSLDYLVLTHTDSDHIGSADVIITKFDIKEVFLSDFPKDNRTYDRLMEALEYKRYKHTQPSIGATYPLGNAVVTFLGPVAVYDEPNNTSLITKVTLANTSFLFTGDAEYDAEQGLVGSSLNLSADVYKAGHHGSSTSSCDAFLDRVTPSHAVISCGKGNEYGHPHIETLERLSGRGIAYYRTDMQGTVIATSNGTDIQFNQSPITAISKEPAIQIDAPVLLPDEDNPSKHPDAETSTESEISEEDEGKDITYILNTASKKFHRTDCMAVTKIASQNRRDVTWNREECISEGYSYCGICQP